MLSISLFTLLVINLFNNLFNFATCCLPKNGIDHKCYKKASSGGVILATVQQGNYHFEMLSSPKNLKFAQNRRQKLTIKLDILNYRYLGYLVLGEIIRSTPNISKIISKS